MSESKAEQPDQPLSAYDKIARLRAKFLEQLPERVAQVRERFEQLKATPDDHAAAVDLHRFLHNLKGTGRSFGFSELGATAGQSEDLITEILDAPSMLPPEYWHGRMEKYIELIELAAGVICSPEGSDAGDDEPSYILPSVTDARGGGSLIYICDDEELTLEQLSTQLNCFGYETLTFTDPLQLREAVLTRWPDAVVMDIHFPQSNDAGTEMLAKIRDETGMTVPAVFVSARDDFAARLAAVQAGGEAYFHKPICVMELMTVLDQLTSGPLPDPYRVLIVDDEPEIASYHSIILQEAGMITQHLSEPSDLLRTLSEFSPDMVLMDMYMPTCTGRDLAKLIRQLSEYVCLPIVYLSSETDRQKQISAMRVGAEGFLTKPVIPDDLVAAVVIRAERMRTLRSFMARDSLTGLLNHTTTTQFLESAIATAKRNHSALCFAMIDIDNFKSVNDTYGHPTGDQVLLALSRILQQRLRDSDDVGRYGGEEFAAILPGASIERGVALINELREDFSRVVFHAPNGDFSCTFSAGVASQATHPTLGSLREAADRALYVAKRSGRNRVLMDAAEPNEENQR